MPPSIMTGSSKIPKPSDISKDNIIKPSFDELSEEHHQALRHTRRNLMRKRWIGSSLTSTKIVKVISHQLARSCSLLYTARNR
jgi:hypothetical protein